MIWIKVVMYFVKGLVPTETKVPRSEFKKIW